MAAIAKADWPRNWAVEAEPDDISGIDRWLRATLSSPHDMPEWERLASPLENVNTCLRKSTGAELRFDLTNER